MQMTAKFEAEGESFNACFEQLNSVFNAEFSASGGGQDGKDGATFIPSVSTEGVISWTNDRELPNPPPVNIKGDKGDRGEQGIQGIQGEKGEKGDTGEAGKDGTSVQSDWNVNDENDPAYVKNRTHWTEQFFEPIRANLSTTIDADRIDASALGLGVFVKISEQVLSLEQLDGATIDCENRIDIGNSQVEVLPPEETLGFTIGSFYTRNSFGNDLIYGYIFVAPSAMDIPEYGLSIPSAGTYIAHSSIDYEYWAVVLEKTKNHQIDDKYVPYKRLYHIGASGVVYANGDNYTLRISNEDFQHIYNVQAAIVTLYWEDINIQLRVPAFFVMVNAMEYIAKQIICVDNTEYLVEFRIQGNDLIVRATPFTPEEYQTESQVKALINDALGVIENGSY